MGPYWLRNLYFLYLLELRALSKASAYLAAQRYHTGETEEDIDTQVQENPRRHGCQMAKFDPFLSLGCARVEGGGRNPMKGKDQILQHSIPERQSWMRSSRVD